MSGTSDKSQSAHAIAAIDKAAQAAILPVVSGLWNAHEIRTYLAANLITYLKDVELEELVAPDRMIAGSILEIIRYSIDNSARLALCTHLLATAMQKSRAHLAHPAFAEIIRQLSNDEEKILHLFLQDVPLPLINLRWEYKAGVEGKSGGKEVLLNFSHLGLQAGCEHPLLAATYADNLCRLGLAEMPLFYHYTAPDIYQSLESDSIVHKLLRDIEEDTDRQAVIERKGLRVTALGRQFLHACVEWKIES